jgi:hypothetical protein
MPVHDRKHPAAEGQVPSQELVLAALSRACLHAPGAGPGVRVQAVLDHLDIRERTLEARAVRAALASLAATGHARCVRHRGRELWAPSADGMLRLADARAAWRPAALPESPQHRAWRTATSTAALEIDRLRVSLAGSLEDASRLLAADSAAHSDDWFELAERLRRDAHRLGSAVHCLGEWREPDDDRPDVDELGGEGDGALCERRRQQLRALRAGRRNLSLWR